jgi:hypothetical protein
MCWDVKLDKKSEIMEYAVAKAISAVISSEGGYLLIGDGDNKQI